MAIVRVVGFDPATGKEHTLTTGDTIENFGGIVAGVNFKGALPDVGSIPAEVDRTVGDMWTVTSGVPITDPEGTGQTLQPGDEVVWDGTQWVVIGNASLPNVEAALITVLAADEDMLIRIGGALGALNVGAIGNVLQVIDGGGAVPQVAWGAAPAGGWTPPQLTFDFTAITTGDVDLTPAVGGVAFVLGTNPGGIPTQPRYLLPDPGPLPLGTEIHVRHEGSFHWASSPGPGGAPGAFPIIFDLAVGAGGTIENKLVGPPDLYFHVEDPLAPSLTEYFGGVTFRVTDYKGKDWTIVDHWHRIWNVSAP